MTSKTMISFNGEKFTARRQGCKPYAISIETALAYFNACAAYLTQSAYQELSYIVLRSPIRN